MIILENLSTSSTSANRFRMTSNIPYFLLPKRSVTFLYDGTYWTQLSASNGGGFDVFDDCTGAGGNYNTSASLGLSGISNSGTNSGVRSGSYSADTMGEYEYTTGTTALGYATTSFLVRRGGGNNAFGTGSTANMPYVTVGKIAISTLATALQDYQVYFGMNGTASLPGASPAIGFLWHYAGNSNPVWTVRSQNTGGTITTVNTAITVTTGYIWLGVYKPGGTTAANGREAVYFYSTDGVIYQMASKFNGATGTYGGSPTVGISSLVGTSQKLLNLEWMGASFNLAR